MILPDRLTHNLPDTIRTHNERQTMNEYQLNGYANRREYLESLCEEYPRDIVYMLADLLGSSEDFDGLVTSLDDYAFDM